MVAEGGEGAIDLLGEHGAGKLVGERHGRQRQQEIRAGFPGRGQTIGAADEKE